MSGTYKAPKRGSESFTCSYCGTLAQQIWKEVGKRRYNYDSFTITKLGYSQCVACEREALWNGDNLLLPNGAAEPPHLSMPATLQEDYEEASKIAAASPRSAAALLRLCLQKLCKELGKPGKNINDDIASLVGDGLPVRIQQALDILRVVGNEQVHPGTLDVRDDPQTVADLFKLINLIIENRIAEPKAVQEMYDRLPEAKRKAIEERDRRGLVENA